MPSFQELDNISIQDLRETGTTKWNREDQAIGAFVAEMDFGVAEPIKQRLHAEVDNQLFAYLPPKYQTELRNSVSSYIRDVQGWEIEPTQVYEMPDVIACYRAAYTSFTKPGSKIIVPTPSYMPFLSAPPADGREVLEVPMHVDEDTQTYTYDLEAIEAAFDAGGELLVLCNPHNPTGRVMRREELQSIEELVDRKNGRVFSDEIWSPLVFEPNRHISYASIGPRAAEHTITAMAALKAFNLPGLKCSQLILTNPADQKHWEEIGFLDMHGAANLGLAATSAAFDDSREWLGDILGYLERNRDTLVNMVAELMPKAKVTTPEGTYVAWIDLSAYDIQGSLSDYLVEHAGVMCTEGTACGEAGKDHVRFIFAMPHPILQESVEKIAQALNRLTPS